MEISQSKMKEGWNNLSPSQRLQVFDATHDDLSFALTPALEEPNKPFPLPTLVFNTNFPTNLLRPPEPSGEEEEEISANSVAPPTPPPPHLAPIRGVADASEIGRHN